MTLVEMAKLQDKELERLYAIEEEHEKLLKAYEELKKENEELRKKCEH
ncbi:MAG: hypothetical protein J6Y78_09190 [Paludibacteraceae bacterium]|nr:hypothetical protein [Paludibacteraceae bacterium]